MFSSFYSNSYVSAKQNQKHNSAMFVVVIIVVVAVSKVFCLKVKNQKNLTIKLDLLVPCLVGFNNNNTRRKQKHATEKVMSVRQSER